MCLICERARLLDQADRIHGKRSASLGIAAAAPTVEAAAPTVVRDYTALLSSSSLNGSPGVGAFYSFSFQEEIADYHRDVYSEAGLATFRPLTADERNVVRAAIQAWASVSGLAIFEVAPGEGDIKFGVYNLIALGQSPATLGFAYYPSPLASSRISSDVFLGTVTPYVVLHEIGHALGLKHPFEGSVQLASDLDNTANTILSYTSTVGANSALGSLDVDAIRYLYGDANADGDHVSAWAWDPIARVLQQSGSEADDRLRGIGGSDIISGAGGNDSISGAEGDDRLAGNAGDDYIVGNAGDDEIRGGKGVDRIDGNAGDDILFGGEGNDAFDYSGGGRDMISGGAGQDILRFDLKSDALPGEFDGGGGDDVLWITLNPFSEVTRLSLPDEGAGGFVLHSVETIYLTGNSSDNIIIGSVDVGGVLWGAEGNDMVFGGNAYDRIDGGAGDDILYAGTGSNRLTASPRGDELTGGPGADRFVFRSSNDSTDAGRTMITDFLAGVDRIDLTSVPLWDYQFVTVSGRKQISGIGRDGRFALTLPFSTTAADILLAPNTPADIVGTPAADTRSGTAGTDFLSGLAGADTLVGFGGDDILVGGTDIDSLLGGAGDDVYYVDRRDDLIFEDAGNGVDSVFAAGDFYLYAEVENLTLEIGALRSFGVGNALANVLTGNSGSNLLIAGGDDDVVYGHEGNDSLFGEAGDDILVGDRDIDYLVGGDGDDRLDGGESPDSLYGEGGDDLLIGGPDFVTDILVGGDGDDVLRADSGNFDYDLLDGGSGDDEYWVDTGDDLTFEAAGGGIDTVFADIDLENSGVYLYPNVENLYLVGETTFGVGNDGDNVINGNEADNLLIGGNGNDTLIGRGGTDSLFGQAGADIFVSLRGGGGDVIGDFQPGTDRIDVSGHDIASYAQLLPAIFEVAGTTGINLGGGDFLVLNGIPRAALSAADFVFG